jgi:hypothetical protein
MLFEINLPGIKALYVGEIMAGRTLFKRLARTFESTLYKTLYKLIGRNSITQAGVLVFGLRTIFVLFKPYGITSEFRISIIDRHTSSPIVTQFF